jgi:signal transduction histidine kinase/ActR/RegA family two-component response regulator
MRAADLAIRGRWRGLRRPGIRGRMLAASAVLAVAVAVPAVTEQQALDDTGHARSADDTAERVVVQTDDTLQLVLELETGSRGYLISRERKLLEPWAAARPQLPGATARLVELTRDEPGQAALAAAIRAAALSYLHAYSEPLVARASRNRTAALTTVVAGEGKRRVDDLRGLLDRLEARQLAIADSQRAGGANASRSASRIGLLGLIASGVMIVAFFAYLAARVVRPLRRLSRSAKQMRDGDLSTRVPETGPGEVGGLARAFNEMAAALDASRIELERVSQAKSEFLSRVSHELRTPLNAVIGFGQLLEMDGLSADQSESVRQILSAGRHLLDLINEVLEISRIEAGTMRVSLEPVALRALVADVLSMVGPLAEQREVALSDGGEACELHVLADQQRLKQVLLNLLSNAVKYNRKGGHVDVTCSCDEERVMLAIADTGPGMGPEQLERAFAPFERLGAEQIGIQGTGLGLALARRLAELMGGSLEARSAPGAGSTFTLTLARVDAPPLGEERASAVPSPVDADDLPTILYIEDNLSNVKLVERIFHDRRPVRLLTATHGRLGLDLAREHRPALVLLDVHLPDMQGHELVARLRAEPSLRSVPVVVLSADATASQRRQLHDAGADDYLTKPLDVRDFLRTVERALENSAAR